MAVMWMKYGQGEQLETPKNIMDMDSTEFTKLSETDEYADPTILMQRCRIRSDFGVGAYRGIIPGKPRFDYRQATIHLMMPVFFLTICALMGLLYLQMPGDIVKSMANITINASSIIDTSLNRTKRQATELKEKDGVLPYFYVQKNAFQEHMTMVRNRVFEDGGYSKHGIFVCTPDSIEVLSPREIDFQEAQCLVRLMLCDIKGDIQLMGFRGIGFTRINTSLVKNHVTHYVVTDRNELEQRITQLEKTEGKTNNTIRRTRAVRRAGYLIYTEPPTKCLDYNDRECQDEAYIALEATIFINGEWGKTQELRCRTGGWNNMNQDEIRKTAYFCSLEWRNHVRGYGWLTDKEFSLSIAKVPTFSLCFRGIGEGVHLGENENCRTIVTWPDLQAGTTAIADRFWLCGGRAFAQLPPNWSGICSVVALQSNYLVISKFELKENMASVIHEDSANIGNEDSANIWKKSVVPVVPDQPPAGSPTRWQRLDLELFTLENEMSRGTSKTLERKSKLPYFLMKQNKYYLDKVRAEMMGLALRLGGENCCVLLCQEILPGMTL